jgi:2-polyprenyl-3-methyl-5-hydroxy-6-metoxy-1,4-benzoquinol methylase
MKNKNLFIEFPEFIENDPRLGRGQTYGFIKINPELYQNTPSHLGGYDINFDIQYHRHNTVLPPELVKDKTILDLGSCIGASGAWVLANGAKRYVGVEYLQSFVNEAEKNLSKYFPTSDWKIYAISIESFLRFNIEKFDIVLAWGIAFVSTNIDSFIDEILVHCNDSLIIDAGIPRHLSKIKQRSKLTQVSEEIDDLPVFGLYRSGVKLVGEPSFSYMKEMLQTKNFTVSKDNTRTLRKLTEPNYDYRWCATFKKNQKTFDNPYAKSWDFDTVVPNFTDHAERHIPNYQQVLTKSVKTCQHIFGNKKDIKVVDFGCALGETLLLFANAGYTDLTGVDANPSMLANAKKRIDPFHDVRWINASHFPSEMGPFDVILCNWTLHFIQNKVNYLRSMIDSLNPGGVLILSDKTETTGIDLEMYHEFKRSQQVSDAEIQAKHNSVKDMMYINDPQWYIGTLQYLGASRVSIIDADFCFTTFLAIR